MRGLQEIVAMNEEAANRELQKDLEAYYRVRDARMPRLNEMVIKTVNRAREAGHEQGYKAGFARGYEMGYDSCDRFQNMAEQECKCEGCENNPLTGSDK